MTFLADLSDFKVDFPDADPVADRQLPEVNPGSGDVLGKCPGLEALAEFCKVPDNIQVSKMLKRVKFYPISDWALRLFI